MKKTKNSAEIAATEAALDELTKLNEDMNLYEDEMLDNPLIKRSVSDGHVNGDDVNRGYVGGDVGGYVQNVTDFAQEKMSEETNTVNEIIADEAKESSTLVIAQASEMLQSVHELYSEAERLLESTMDYHSAALGAHTLRFMRNGKFNGLYLCEGTDNRHFSVVPELLLTQKLKLLKQLMSTADQSVRVFNTTVAKALARAKK